MTADSGDGPDFSSPDWHKMFGDSRFQYVLDTEEAESEDQDYDSVDY